MKHIQKPLLPFAEHFYAFDEEVVAVKVHEHNVQSARIPEALVHDLWHRQHFRRNEIETTDGRPVSILYPGTPNLHDGPDFIDARLVIDGVTWSGNVEIHLSSADWYVHRHESDARYNSVILHVTLEADTWTGNLKRADGSVIPEIVLFDHLQTPLRSLVYEFRTRRPDGLPCAAQFVRTTRDDILAVVSGLARERIRSKYQSMHSALEAGFSETEVLYTRSFAALGFAPNAAAMAELALRIPLAVARSLRDRRELEALYLGTAGLLPFPSELLEADRETADYCIELRDRYALIRRYCKVDEMNRESWRFSRLRPANFPTLRIAQAIAWFLPGGLFHGDPRRILTEALQTEDPLLEVRKRLRAVAGPFWDQRVRPDRLAKSSAPALGRDRIDTLIVNVVAPWLLLFGERCGDAFLSQRPFDLFDRLSCAQDEVTRRFAALGFKPDTAYEAQGVHQLFRTRCTQGRCLTCPIGRKMITEE
jgi:hypothetical protein